MPLSGEYEPSPSAWVRDQVEAYESSGGARGNKLGDTDMPVVIVTARGRSTGKIRKWPVMRVENNGEYALVASKGGAPENPTWYQNLVAHPDEVMIQDGPEPFDAQVRELSGEEREQWWRRAVQAYPPYAEYKEKTDRTIPVLLATPRG
jgi:F420H(2)-dependent quinone reductase